MCLSFTPSKCNINSLEVELKPFRATLLLEPRITNICVKNQVRAHHVTRHITPIHNILSIVPQLSISWKALGTLVEDGNVMPKHVEATIM
jgi:hypothetical protein